jgi:(S)-mandelate dehydrogenase
VSALQSAITIEDLRRMARKRLPDFLFGPMDAGAGDGAGCARNIRRLRDQLLLPRALVDISAGAQVTSIFGREYSVPFGISAIGYAGNYRRHADILFAESARSANIPFILSGASTSSVEAVARIAPDHAWYQLYGARDRGLTDRLIGRARDVGVKVLVFTVDFPIAPRLERIMRTGVRPPAHVPLRSLPYVILELLKHPAWALEFAFQGGPVGLDSWAAYAPPGSNAAAIAKINSAQVPSNQTWQDLEHIRALWPGKLIVKGLLHADDARRAADLGADAVTVSNHGSVKLDCMPATIDVLPSIARAVGHRIPVLFDGGIRCGHDVLVALCLGAKFCFVGRAALYGVSAAGRAGIDRTIEILREEVIHTMAMIGCPTIDQLGTQFIFTPLAAHLPAS